LKEFGGGVVGEQRKEILKRGFLRKHLLLLGKEGYEGFGDEQGGNIEDKKITD